MLNHRMRLILMILTLGTLLGLVGARALADATAAPAAQPAATTQPAQPAATAQSAQPAQPADDQTLNLINFADRVRRDAQWLAGFDSRVVGSDGHRQALAGLLERVNRHRGRPGVRIWTHTFDVVVPVTEKAQLTLAGEKHRVYPIWPASARANTTPPEGIAGRLVYVGRGEYNELRPRSLRGNIAVMEMSGGANWESAYSTGARAIILLGGENDTIGSAHSHVLPLPLNVPRFYVPEGPLAERLRSLSPSDQTRGELKANVQFKQVQATNIYVLVGPSGEPAVAVAAAFDSMSVVPELAPGADVAVDAATLLNTLDYMAGVESPHRPVLFSFIDAFALNQRGVREMLLALNSTNKETGSLVGEDEDYLEEYAEVARLLDQLGTGDQALSRLQNRDYVELHRYVKDEAARGVVAVRTMSDPLVIKAHAPGVDPAEKARLLAEVERLNDQRLAYLNAQHLLVSKGVGDLMARANSSDPSVRKDAQATLALVRSIWAAVESRVRGQLDDVQARLAVHQRRRQLRDELRAALGLSGEANAEPRAIAFMLGLDLSDAGASIGPRPYCGLRAMNESGNAKDYLSWLRNVSKGTRQIWPGIQSAVVNLAPLQAVDSPESHVVGRAANLTSPAQSFGAAGATWGVLDAIRLRVDTPGDRADLLDWSRLTPQVDATLSMLRRLTEANNGFKPTSKVAALWSRVSGAVVDQSPGEPVPRVPMQGYLTTMVAGLTRGGSIGFAARPIGEGVRTDEFVFTGADGMFFFDAQAAANLAPGHEKFIIQSFQLAGDDGRIVRAVDLTKVGKGIRVDVNIASPGSPRRAVVFTCGEVNVVGLFDPRFLLNLPLATVLDARRAGRPQRMNLSLTGGKMVCLLEPDIKWQAVLRAGSTENRMALLNIEGLQRGDDASTRDAMKGFATGEPLAEGPMEIAVRDFYRLDARRMADYERAGIVSEIINRIHGKTEAKLEAIQQALADDDGAALQAAVSSGLSNEVRAYQAVRDLASDVVLAAIFLLLALVPFSFAMERLLFASPHVYRQLGGIVAIFGLMTATLWSFHPAFRISNQPLMIIMAFGIIFMSLLVMSIVYQKFKSQLEEMRSGRAESSGARTSRGGLAASAIRLGIANMRKRKLRTALTGATVMLITFALLCFTSVSSYVEHQERTLSSVSPYTGLLIRQPQSRAMPAEALPTVQVALSRHDVIVPQYWWCNPRQPMWRIHVSNPCGGGLNFGSTFTQWQSAMTGNVRWSRNQISLNAALGLSAGEEKLTGVDKVLGGWDRFVAGGGCYMSTEAADTLGVKPGDSVVVAGQSLQLIDVYRPDDFNTIRMMTGESMMPTNYSALGEEQRNLLASQSQEQLSSEMASGAALEPDTQLPSLNAADVLILPAKMVAGLPDGSLRSVGILADSLEQAKASANEMADRVAFPIYYGSPEGVHVLASTALTPQGPKSLLIMLVIAGLIIFNTMLNSIAERKKEIHIYTSLGLAPLHIGVLFLAEAATYGLMGSIFGYIVGQGVATLLTHFDLMGGVTLNYSGTQAILTMVMVLGVVLLSALVPAYMAGKLASPSEHMKWAVPAPVNDTIRDTLPFTVTDKTANGVAMFLYDYLDAHREGSIGHFSTDNLRLVRTRTDAGELLGVESTVWLAPYDLGVRQDVRITIRPTAEQAILEIDVELRREAGQLRSWWKLNRVFLGDLRRQLLGWRKLKTERVLQYIAEGRQSLQSAATV